MYEIDKNIEIFSAHEKGNTIFIIETRDMISTIHNAFTSGNKYPITETSVHDTLP